MSFRKWGSMPILDAFRPQAGWKTDYAVFGSYSANPVALMAVLLALSGKDDDRGSGTAVDLADTIEELRGRVVFLIQKGRMSVPIKAQTVLKVLDNFVREIDCDESFESWHPKVALIRQSRARQSKEDEEQHCWRFWMGSRNLTRDRSWDAGLLLLGVVEKKGKTIPGLIEAAELLWNKAGLKKSDIKSRKKELSRVCWIHPPGCKVKEIKFLHPLTEGRGLPEEPRRIESLLVVSPFLDGGTVEALGKWNSPAKNRTLLSTHLTLSGIAKQKKPLMYFDKGEVLYMGALDKDEDRDILSEETDEKKNEDAALDDLGLHAKLILAYRKGQSTLWLGSPNATKRAWKKNYEIVACLSLCQELAEELKEFAKRAKVFVVEDLKPELVPHEEEVIESAYKQVVSRWHVRQKDWSLYSKAAPHPDNPKVLLEVGILGNDLVQWPKKAKVLKLRKGNPPIETEFVQVRISFKKAERCWLQKAPLDSPIGVERDRNAVATILTPRMFLNWIRAILDGVPPGGEAWDREGNHSPGQSLLERCIPTLEDILKAWSYNPVILKVLDERMKAYMKYIRKSSNEAVDEMRVLEDFEKVWRIVRSELHEEG